MTRTTKDEQPPERRNWVSALGPDATKAGRAAFARAGFLDPTLVLRWDEIAGAETARLAVPMRFSEGPAGGVLTLKAEPGAALFLQHDARALTERINAYLGRPAVSRLKFVQGSLGSRPAPRPPKSGPGPLSASDPARRYHGPEKLREALEALARARASKAKIDR